MGEELTLASKGDLAFDVARFLRLVIFGHLPEWVRYPLFAVGASLAVHAGLGWLRSRFGEAREDGRPVQEDDARVR
ncbi:hypothetical protein [Streptomyces sp. LMG1-1-1.1]|uniref:hypothetical protein n=1 Tax=Streptomyces sp. LMG1-1-1.1 TaxID=3135245 RepID=UPI003467E126